MSGESTPLLSGAIPAFELFMTRWEKLEEEKPYLARFIDKGLDSAYKYCKWMDRTRVYIIAMCKWIINPQIRTNDCISSPQSIRPSVMDMETLGTTIYYRRGGKNLRNGKIL
jgi:hypothetical protein